MMTVITRKAYSEIDEFLELLSDEERNKVPKKLRDFFKAEKDDTYIKGIDANNPIKEQHLLEETLAIIAYLNLQYWCESEEEKKRLLKIYNENEKKYQEELRKKYNPDNIFNNQNNVSKLDNSSETALVLIKKENIFIKIMNKLKSILKK